MLPCRRLALLVLVASAPLWAQSQTDNPSSEPGKPSEAASKRETSPATNPSATSSATGDSTRLEPIETPKAVYPLKAAQQGIQGQVWVKLLISEGGEVEDVDVISGEPILAKAAVDAVKKWKFKPFIKNGKAAEVSTKVPINFAFNDNIVDKGSPAESDTASDSKKTPKQVPSDDPSVPSSSPGTASTSSDTGDGVKRVRVAQAVSQGLLVHRVQPVYPLEARANHVEGTVVLRAVIDKEGRISDLKPISGPAQLIPAAVRRCATVALPALPSPGPACGGANTDHGEFPPHTHTVLARPPFGTGCY